MLFRRMSRLPPHPTRCSVLTLPKEESLPLNESMLFAYVTTPTREAAKITVPIVVTVPPFTARRRGR